jgi:hypothetical protein
VEKGGVLGGFYADVKGSNGVGEREKGWSMVKWRL